MGLLQRADEEAARRVHDLSGEDEITFIGYAARGRDLELEPGTGLLCQAVKERFPTTCSDDALDHVGDTMQIERYPAEANDTYRARLSGAFDAHSWAGTAKGIEDQFTAALTAMGAAAPVVTVIENWNGAYADGADWYSRIAVVIQCGGVWSGGTLGGSWVLGLMALGSTARVGEIALMKRIVRKWKDASAYPGVLRVVLDATVDVLGIDWTLGTSALADPTKVTEWVMGPLFGSTWFLGSTPLADYEI